MDPSIKAIKNIPNMESKFRYAHQYILCYINRGIRTVTGLNSKRC